MIRKWLYGAFFAIASFLGVVLYRSGKSNVEVKQVRRRVDAMEKAKETRHEVETSDDDRLLDILTGRVRK